MKNKGLLMIVLLLAFCCVLTGYAMTEGATERLEIDADKVVSIDYVMAGEEHDGVEITDMAYIRQIVTEVNNLELRKANFKIKRSDLNEMTGIMILSGDVFAGEEPEFVSLWFLPDNRIIAAWDGKEGMFTADSTQLNELAEKLSCQTLLNDPYAKAAIMFGIHEDMLE